MAIFSWVGGLIPLPEVLHREVVICDGSDFTIHALTVPLQNGVVPFPSEILERVPALVLRTDGQAHENEQETYKDKSLFALHWLLP